jgi:hypothetical protein
MQLASSIRVVVRCSSLPESQWHRAESPHGESDEESGPAHRFLLPTDRGARLPGRGSPLCELDRRFLPTRDVAWVSSRNHCPSLTFLPIDRVPPSARIGTRAGGEPRSASFALSGHAASTRWDRRETQARCSGGMPSPVSITRTTTSSLMARAESTICPPGGCGGSRFPDGYEDKAGGMAPRAGRKLIDEPHGGVSDTEASAKGVPAHVFSSPSGARST